MTRKLLFSVLVLLGLVALPWNLSAQIQSLSTTNQAGNGSGGITFEITATQTVNIQHLWVQHLTAGNTNVQIWARSGGFGVTPPNVSTAGGWSRLIDTTMTATTGNPSQIPGTLNLVINAGQTYAFFIGVPTGTTGNTVAYTTGTTGFQYIFSDLNISIDTEAYGGNAPSPGFFPRVFNGRVDYIAGSTSNDAGVISIDSVVAACPGPQDIWTTIGNFGSNLLDSVTVNWSWNGTVQTPIQVTTQLDTFGGLGQTTAPVFLGNQNLAQGQIYDLKVWTSNPNGVADTANYNDTLQTQVAASLSGTFTINSGAATTGSNFNSFTEAVNALNNFGVCGPTTFNVVAGSGPYEEQITIGEITGTSAVNTVTFNGGATKETIYWDSTTFTNRDVVYINGADHLTLENLTIGAYNVSNSNTGRAVFMENDANFNTIRNCNIEVDTTNSATGFNVRALEVNRGANDLTIEGNNIRGGYYSLYMFGPATNNKNVNNVVRNNNITESYAYGTYFYNQYNLTVENNYVAHRKTGSTTTFGYGSYMFYVDSAQVRKNEFYGFPTYGVYMFQNNNRNVPTLRSEFSNNMISAGLYGVYMTSNTRNIDFLNNSISLDAALNSSSTSRGVFFNGTTVTGMDVRNNSFAVYNNLNGFALYSTDTIHFDNLDYNNYHVDGSLNAIFLDRITYDTASFVGAAGFNNNSIYGDPFYRDIQFNLRTRGSQLYNRGVNLAGVTDDIDGEARPKDFIYDIGADEYSPPPYDLVLVNVIEPVSPYCSFDSQQTVTAVFTNFGTEGIPYSELLLGFGAQGPINTPPTFETPTTNDTLFTNDILTYTFTATANLGLPGSYTFAVGGGFTPLSTITDGDSSNNADTLLLEPGIAGTYTINSGQPTGGTNYNSFTAAVNDMIANGICGPTVFNVTPGSGPYNEKVVIPVIQGVSATNTITFDGGATQEEIFNNSFNASDRAVFTIDGADYLTFRNLTIGAYGTGTYAAAFNIYDQADYNTVENCRIRVDTASNQTSFNRRGINLSSNWGGSGFADPAGNFNTFQDNVVEGGYYGIYVYGGSPFSRGQERDTGNVVIGNEVTDFTVYGIYTYNQNLPMVNENFVSRRTTQTGFGYGMYFGYCDSTFEVRKNYVNMGAAATSTVASLFMFSTNDQGGNSRGTITNNMLISPRYGMYMSSNADQNDIYHNSISIVKGAPNGIGLWNTSTTSTDNAVVNNSFAVFGNTSGSDYAVDIQDTVFANTFNYNNFYVEGQTQLLLYGSTFYDTAGYRGAGGFNANSQHGDPGYVDNSNNLHAVSTQLWNVGTNLNAVTEDYDGDPRPRTFISDIGADEFDPPAKEASLVGFVTPVDGCDIGSSADVSVRIANNGLDTITSIALTYVLNNGTPVTDTVNASIPPGSSFRYTFTTPANLGAFTTYTFDAYLSLVGDSIFVNDSISGYTVLNRSVISGVNYFQNFDDTTWTPDNSNAYIGTPVISLADGWVNSQTDGPQDWAVRSDPPRFISTVANFTGDHTTGSTNYLYMEDDFPFSGNPNVVLLSPCWDVSNVSAPYLKYWVNSTLTFTFQQPNSVILDVLYQDSVYAGVDTIGDEGTGWVEKELDLRLYKNGPVSVRFRGSNANSTGHDIAIDDVGIVDIPPTDVGVSDVILPRSRGTCGDSSVAVEVQLQGFGSSPQTSIPITVVVTDTLGNVVATLSNTYTRTPGLDRNEFDTAFVGTFNALRGGYFFVRAYTGLAGDGDNDNDTTISAQIFIQPVPAPPMVNSPVLCNNDSALLTVMNPDPTLTYFWYDDPQGTNLIASDTTAFQTPQIAATRNYYVRAESPALGNLALTELDSENNGDWVEFQNLSNDSVDATGWFIVLGTTSTNINNIVSQTWPLGKFGPGDISYTTDISSDPNYIGTNIPWSSSTRAWAMIVDDQGNVVDAVFANHTASDIATGINFTVNGFTITSADVPWVGPSVNKTQSNISRFGSADNDDATDWVLSSSNATQGTQNANLPTSIFVGCPGELATVPVVVSTPPQADLGGDVFQCGSVTLDPNPAGTTFANYNWSSGDTTSTITVSQSGTYSVQVTNVDGCQASDTVNVVLFPVPTVNLGQDTTVCGSLLLDAGNPGSVVQWDDGTTGQTKLATTTKTYVATVTNADGCVETDSIDVTVNDLPIVDLGMDRTECDEATLSVNDPNASVVWDDLSTNPTRTVTSSGQYTVTATNLTNGCIAEDTVNITIAPAPTVDLGVDTTVCKLIVLDAGVANAQVYDWSTGDLTQTATVAPATLPATQTVSVRVEDINGCEGQDTITVDFHDDPFANFQATNNFLDLTLTNASTGGGLTYLWDFGDGTTSTMETPTHTYATGGNYTVSLQVTNACGTDAIDTRVTVSGVGIEDGLLAGQISIYPNPTKDVASVDFGSLNRDVSMTVYDVRGRKLMQREITRFEQQDRVTIDLREAAEGVYTVVFETANGRLIRKIVRE